MRRRGKNKDGNLRMYGPVPRGKLAEQARPFGPHYKAFKGSTFGPASPCKVLSPEERKALEDDMRRKGLLA